MKWVRNFYEKQYNLLGAYHAEPRIESYHYDIVAELEKHAPQPLQTILELGAGTGEVSTAAAIKGYKVTAIELVPELTKKMNQLKRNDNSQGKLTSICGDFYDVVLTDTYDLVIYLDGFGIGTDHDQKHLLQRISHWLHPEGCALIDIYTPWYWSKHAGQQMHFRKFSRRYDYDFDGARMLDTWRTHSDSDSDSITQSLRCYTPADLKMLLEGTGLQLVGIIPGGSLNYETGEYREHVPLGEAMTYQAKLEKI